MELEGSVNIREKDGTKSASSRLLGLPGKTDRSAVSWGPLTVHWGEKIACAWATPSLPPLEAVKGKE